MATLDERGRHVFGSAVQGDGRLQLVAKILENGFRVFEAAVVASGAAAWIKRRRR